MEHGFEIILVLVHVVNNVGEKSVEDLEATINLKYDFRIDEFENQCKEILPDFLI